MNVSTLLELMNTPGTVICRQPDSDFWALFSKPTKIYSSSVANEISSLLNTIESHVQSGGMTAGFMSYEAGQAFDPSFVVKPVENFPLAWFGTYSSHQTIHEFPEPEFDFPDHTFTPEITEEEYTSEIERVLSYIEEGDIYQANYTFRALSTVIREPEKLFLYLMNTHPVPYGAFVNTGTDKIVSLSPELFIERTGSTLSSLPMKGTAKRSPISTRDKELAVEHSKDEKNRAENVMIVDMVRNDFGRVCIPESIEVDPLFHVDTYQTLHQMISRVYGKVAATTTFGKIMQATFPAASITGAPKIRAMEIIDETETSPRKVYTGSIGAMTSPDTFCFNVAIRTLICDDKQTELGIGSGVVADSTAGSEWKECLLKSSFASHKAEPFDILETALFTKDAGITFLDEHVKRARNSAHYFQRKWNEPQIVTTLKELEKHLFNQDCEFVRVRMIFNRDGNVTTETFQLDSSGWGNDELSICIADEQTNSKDRFLYHKTTNREFYNTWFRKALDAGYNEVIFCNEHGNVTEGSISNIFIEKDGKWLTPPLTDGLLNGVYRQKLIEKLNAQEQSLPLNALKEADSVIISNSVRGKGHVTNIIPI